MVRESDMKPSISTAGLAILLLCFTILSMIFFPTQTVAVQRVGWASASLHAASLPSNRPFDYILIILMENKNFSQINGSASAPYLNQLAHNYSLATHVPDRREQLLHRNKLPPRQDRVLQATLASWIELRARADPKGRRSTVGACRLGRFRVLGRSRLCTLHPPTPAIRHASQTIHLMLYTALSIVRKLRVQVPCRRS